MVSVVLSVKEFMAPLTKKDPSPILCRMSRTAKGKTVAKVRPFTVTIQLVGEDETRFKAHQARLKIDADAPVALSLLREALDAVEARA